MIMMGMSHWWEVNLLRKHNNVERRNLSPRREGQ